MLGYGIDLNDVKFSDFLENVNCKLTDNNTLLIKRMCKDFPKLNYDEYLDYSYDRTLGGWESINYLIKKGVTSSQKEG